MNKGVSIIKIGIPKGLLYPKYHVFAKTFWEEMGAELVVSPDTNKKILDEGTKYCVDDACLSIKVFHGHVAWLKDRCDAIFVPRLISMKKRQYICPMFCGLPDMLIHNIPGLPLLIDEPLYSTDEGKLAQWIRKTGSVISNDEDLIIRAFAKALLQQKRFIPGQNDQKYPLKVALIGHTYNINDAFINMELIKKINGAGVGVITEEYVDSMKIEEEVAKLFKTPFWVFARNYYGAAISMFREQSIDGIIYLSSFCCGIDSVVVELIQNEIKDFPFLVLKLDEHTGEAGFNTRIEAFLDMLKRRSANANHLSQHGQCLLCDESYV